MSAPFKTRKGITVSPGAAAAGFVPLLNASGKLDQSVFPSTVWFGQVGIGNNSTSPYITIYHTGTSLKFDNASAVTLMSLNVAGVLTVQGLEVNTSLTLPSNVVDRAHLVNGSACSVIGRSANSTGAVADITASTNDRVFGRFSNTLSFGQVPVAAISASGLASAAVLRGDGTWATGVGGSWSVGNALTVGSGGLSVSGGTVTFPSNSLARAALANGSACSVIGRSANSTGVVADIAASSDGQFLRRSSGTLGFGAITAVDLPEGNWITATTGTQTQTTTNLTSNANAWEAITGTLALPTAGTYLVIAQVSAQILASAVVATATVHARIYNTTDAVAVGSPANVVATGVTGVYCAGSATIHAVVTVAAGKTLRVEGMRRTDTGTTYGYSAIEGISNGATRLSYVRLA